MASQFRSNIFTKEKMNTLFQEWRPALYKLVVSNFSKKLLNLLTIHQGLTFKEENPWYINFGVLNNKLLPGNNIPEEKFMLLVDIPKGVEHW